MQNSSKNKYYKLYNDMKKAILCGEYKAGEKLPSKRVVADKTGYSLITVQTAYDMLSEEGYVTAKERSGYFVCKIDAFFSSEIQNAQKPFTRLEEEMGEEEPDFECSVYLRTVRKVISDWHKLLFKKSPQKGCPILRNAIADYLYRYRGMIAEPSRIIIGSGAEQLYETVIKLLGRTKIYGVENPSYVLEKGIYDNAEIKIKLLTMGADGIISSELNRDFDVLHVTPFRSYPSDVTTSVSKHYEYLLWAEKAGGYIIEDDFNSEFFLPGQPIETLYSLGGGKRIIYINTFSKSLSPSIRVGYMILPEELLSVYDEKLGGLACSVPVLDQYVLAEFLESGDFERHLNRVRRKMNKKA